MIDRPQTVSATRIWSLHAAGMMAGLAVAAVVVVSFLSKLMADEVKEGPIFATAATALLSASVTWSGVVRFGLGLHWLRAAMVSLLLLAILSVTCISLAVAYQANIVILAGLSLAALYFGGALALGAR